jgi:hypothetical protein
MWKDYAVPGGTFRENMRNTPGERFLPATHVGAQYRYDVLKQKYGDANGDIIINKTVETN